MGQKCQKMLVKITDLGNKTQVSPKLTAPLVPSKHARRMLSDRKLFDLVLFGGNLIIQSCQEFLLTLTYLDIQTHLSLNIGTALSIKTLLDSFLSLQGSSKWRCLLSSTNIRIFDDRKCRKVYLILFFC